MRARCVSWCWVCARCFLSAARSPQVTFSMEVVAEAGEPRVVGRHDHLLDCRTEGVAARLISRLGDTFPYAALARLPAINIIVALLATATASDPLVTLVALLPVVCALAGTNVTVDPNRADGHGGHGMRAQSVSSLHLIIVAPSGHGKSSTLLQVSGLCVSFCCAH